MRPAQPLRSVAVLSILACAGCAAAPGLRGPSDLDGAAAPLVSDDARASVRAPSSADGAASPTPGLGPSAEAGASGETGPAGSDREAALRALAEAAQNPVAAMYSLPLQYNANFRTGPEDKVLSVLNVQPVVPIPLDDDWNLISRTIVPILGIPDPVDENGLGDVQQSLFLSPAKPCDGWIWGAGPVLRAPTARNEYFGSGRWSAGPSAVVLRVDGPWVAGALVQNLWDFAGDGDRGSVNEFLIQPFVNHNFGHGFYVTSSPILTANWDADRGGDVWTVPVGGGVGQILFLGSQPVNVSLQGYYNVAHADEASTWSIRFQVTFLFPRK